MIQYELFFHTKLNVIATAGPLFFAESAFLDEVEDPTQRGNLVLPSKESFVHREALPPGRCFPCPEACTWRSSKRPKN
jgi:hypothetical protein